MIDCAKRGVLCAIAIFVLFIGCSSAQVSAPAVGKLATPKFVMDPEVKPIDREGAGKQVMRMTNTVLYSTAYSLQPYSLLPTASGPSHAA